MIWTKARARESAARLLANPPCTPRWRRDVSACCRFIGPSWLVPDVPLGGKYVATVRQHFCKASVALNHISNCNLGLSIHRKPALRSTREPATSVVAGPTRSGLFHIFLVSAPPLRGAFSFPAAVAIVASVLICRSITTDLGEGSMVDCDKANHRTRFTALIAQRGVQVFFSLFQR
jgi:hypothetical protein